ncbi:hypothetical protein SALBM311S_05993 [Streptomyces alboniger]
MNRVLEARHGESVTPTEWWLRTTPGQGRPASPRPCGPTPTWTPRGSWCGTRSPSNCATTRSARAPRPRSPRRRCAAAALAAVGFAVSAAGSLRERGAEFAVLRALGAPRRRLARTIAVEQGVLVGLALLVGVALGTVLTRAVIPLVVLTSEAARPVPRVLVELPLTRVAALLVAVTVTPLLVTAALAVRRADPVTSLREQGGE